MISLKPIFSGVWPILRSVLEASFAIAEFHHDIVRSLLRLEIFNHAKPGTAKYLSSPKICVKSYRYTDEKILNSRQYLQWLLSLRWGEFLSPKWAEMGRTKNAKWCVSAVFASFTNLDNPDIRVIPFWETSKSLLSTGNSTKNGVALIRVCHMPTNPWKWWKKQEHHFKPLKLMFTTAQKKGGKALNLSSLIVAAWWS